MISLSFVLVLVTAYLLGSIPFGVVVARLGGMGDIRTKGSGNIGTMNVFRSGSPVLAVLTFLGDAGKGALAVLFAQTLMGESAILPYLAGYMAVVGHVFPIFLKFRGGKGVATALGVLLAFSGWLALTHIVIWMIVAVFYRIASVASITTMVLIPVTAWVWEDVSLSLWGGAVAILILWAHRSNLKRLGSGTEPRLTLNRRS